MMKKISFFVKKNTMIFTLSGLFLAGNAMSQTVNLSRYITLVVHKNDTIELSLAGDAVNTHVRIKSDTIFKDTVIDGNWTGAKKYIAYSDTIVVYGNIKRFNCSNNKTKIQGIDVSQNTQMERLYCSQNGISTLDLSKNVQMTGVLCESTRLTELDISKNTNLEEVRCSNTEISVLNTAANPHLKIVYCFKTKIGSLDISQNGDLAALYCYGTPLSQDKIHLDRLYCSLPRRSDTAMGILQPLLTTGSTNYSTIMETNITNAQERKWKVQTYTGNQDITTSNGTYNCGSNLAQTAQDEMSITLYPNPAKEELTITAAERIEHLEIIDLTGEILVKASPKQLLFNVNLSTIPAGMYILRVVGKDATTVRQFVRQ